MHLSKGISTSATAINCVISHMQPSHPMESLMHVHIQLHIMYRMTPTVFSWGTQQQWQQFLMTAYMTSLCSRHSTQRPPDCSLSAWQMCTPHGCTERDWRSLEQIGHLRGCAGTSSCSGTCVDCSLKSDLKMNFTASKMNHALCFVYLLDRSELTDQNIHTQVGGLKINAF